MLYKSSYWTKFTCNDSPSWKIRARISVVLPQGISLSVNFDLSDIAVTILAGCRAVASVAGCKIVVAEMVPHWVLRRLSIVGSEFESTV